MNEKLNIETCTTAVESPFSNGTVEHLQSESCWNNGKDRGWEMWSRNSTGLGQ